MLGVLRFVFSILVVAAHIINQKPFLHFGFFAVFGFYIVSGFLITLILNQTYKFKFSTFALNRFLRLYPIYYICSGLALTLILSSPAPEKFHPAWAASTSPIDILGNLLIFPFEFYSSSFRLIPPSWSVGVEIICYFLLWLFIARSRMTATATLLLSATYHAFSLYQGHGWFTRYSPFYAALLPFATGACIYFYLPEITKIFAGIEKKAFTVTLSLWLSNLFICGLITTAGSDAFNVFFYANYALIAIMIAILATKPTSRWLKVPGKHLGDLAYPISLLHWPIAFCISKILERPEGGIEFFLYTAAGCIAASSILSRITDNLIEPLRDTVRNRNPQKQQAQAV